jgi:hypothetical protein
VFSGVGGTNTSVTAGTANAALTAFEAGIGAANNGTGPPKSIGFRTVNWDGVPEASSDPNHLTPDFFNTTSPRGLVLGTPGTALEVSAASGGGIGFGDINATYPSIFPAFSPPKVFSPIGSNVTELSFYAAGTQTPAAVRGFGAIFRNVEVASTTTVEYFDAAGRSLARVSAPVGTSGQAEFLGILFPDPSVAKVEIATGTTALGPTDSPPATNVVALDDLVYSEPQPLPSPSLTIDSPAEAATVADQNLTVTGKASDPAGLVSVTVDGSPVAVAGDGSWSTQITLSPGVNAIAAVALGVGNRVTQATRTVNYVPATHAASCAVPKLRGKTLKAAKRALHAAGCKLGKVSRAVSATPGRVVGQKPKPGRRLPAGSAVAVTVGRS